MLLELDFVSGAILRLLLPRAVFNWFSSGGPLSSAPNSSVTGFSTEVVDRSFFNSSRRSISFWIETWTLCLRDVRRLFVALRDFLLEASNSDFLDFLGRSGLEALLEVRPLNCAFCCADLFGAAKKSEIVRITFEKKSRISDFEESSSDGGICQLLLTTSNMSLVVLYSPYWGLYSSFLGPSVYSLLGTSKHCSIGPAAVSSALTGTIIAWPSDWPTPHNPDSKDSSAELASVLTFFTGVILMLTGFLQLGPIVNFISGPTLVGFITAVSM